MNTAIKRILLILASCLFPLLSAHAQSTVTFQLNLKPQLEDSLFIPGRDRVYIMGDRFPLSPGRRVDLRDLAPADSIFSAEMHFPSAAAGKKLEYRYFLVINNETQEEHMPRSLHITGSDLELDALYFDSFAW